MKRVVIGFMMILHGLAHAAAGMWVTGEQFRAQTVALWSAAMLGYLAAGFGVLRVPIVQRVWKGAFVIATLASLVLLIAFGHPTLVPGVIMDLVIFIIVLLAMPVIEAEGVVVTRNGIATVRHPRMSRLASAAALLFLSYAVVVALVRPMTLTWGTTNSERSRALPGDDLVRDPHYRIDHSIIVKAPARYVWPWLMQLGQDRGGFYSYAWLERAFGARITNADEIHAEWQQRGEGDFLRAVQPDYLGGIFGDSLGWKITRLIPEQMLMLENWGAFVLEPIDSNTTRFTVRTRGDGRPTPTSVLLAPINVFVFEPAHFIMEQKMLRGIRDRAERVYARARDTARCDPTVFARC